MLNFIFELLSATLGIVGIKPSLEVLLDWNQQFAYVKFSLG
jgi:hypothetical protein